jgi:hypothetical protein
LQAGGHRFDPGTLHSSISPSKAISAMKSESVKPIPATAAAPKTAGSSTASGRPPGVGEDGRQPDPE